MKIKISVMVFVVLTIALIGCSAPKVPLTKAEMERRNDWRCSNLGIMYAMNSVVEESWNKFNDGHSMDHPGALRLFILAGGCDSRLSSERAAEVKDILLQIHRQYIQYETFN